MSHRAPQLLRALLAAGARAGGPGSTAALLSLGAAQSGVAAALGAGMQAALQQQQQRGLAALASLAQAQLRQALHTGLPRSAAAAAADEGAPALNPLQQAPPPTAARSVLAPDTAAGAEGPLRARAVLRNTAISPRKLNMFAKVVRGLSVEDALIQCEVSCKKSAAILRNVVLSAKSNAVHNHGLDGDRLVVDEAYVGKGDHVKRTSVHGRGRSGVRLRYRSHLTVVLKEVDEVRRRTTVIPMLAERYWDIQARRQQRGQQAPVRRARRQAQEA